METKTILLVDDVRLFLELGKTFLSRDTFRIITASTGGEALEKARSQHPDLIFLDLHLPDKDGDVVCRILKDDPDTRDIPVIMLTAANRPGDVERCRISGCDDYLTKPVKKGELCRVAEDRFGVAGRLHTRVAVRWPCSVTVDGGSFQAFIKDISEGGAFITTARDLEAGTVLGIAFSMPGRKDTVRVSATVRWGGAAGAGGKGGVGVRFKLINAVDRDAISCYVRSSERNEAVEEMDAADQPVSG